MYDLDYQKTKYGHCGLFFTHLGKFIKAIITKEECQQGIYIGVSGGMDSMALLFSLSHLQDFSGPTNITILHVNHGTREENYKELKLVENFASYLGARFASTEIVDLAQGNFEHYAREARNAFFKLHSKGRPLFLAQHIDDSYEWSMLHSSKSSTLKPSLGIAVRSKYDGLNIFRPFMCVTRKQIERFVEELRIPYMQDPTNLENFYERNYLRNSVIPAISKRFPGHLKHYVNRSNMLAKKLGVSIFASDGEGHIQSFECKNGAIIIYNTKSEKDFSGADEAIKSALYQLSNTQRGKIAKQVENLKDAIKKNKKGPIHFSGGVRAYLDTGAVAFMNSEVEDRYKEMDEYLATQIKQEAAQIPLAINNIKKPHKINMIRDNFPNIILLSTTDLSDKKAQIPIVKRQLSLWPKTSNVLLEYNIGFQTGFNVYRELRKRKFYKKSPLEFVYLDDLVKNFL